MNVINEGKSMGTLFDSQKAFVEAFDRMNTEQLYAKSPDGKWPEFGAWFVLPNRDRKWPWVLAHGLSVPIIACRTSEEALVLAARLNGANIRF